jgi:hypothetical protein
MSQFSVWRVAEAAGCEYGAVLRARKGYRTLDLEVAVNHGSDPARYSVISGSVKLGGWEFLSYKEGVFGMSAHS